MLTGDLQTQALPCLRPDDSINQAIQMMSDNQVTHLPVADNESFLGLLSEDELLQAEDANGSIQELLPTVGNLSVKMSDHFLKALSYLQV